MISIATKKKKPTHDRIKENKYTHDYDQNPMFCGV